MASCIVCVAAGVSSNSSDWSGIIDYSGFIKDNALRCVCLLPVLFWLFYLVTPLFPGFGSGMYGVSLAQLHLCALHARASRPLPCVFLSALHAQHSEHTAHFACKLQHFFRQSQTVGSLTFLNLTFLFSRPSQWQPMHHHRLPRL